MVRIRYTQIARAPEGCLEAKQKFVNTDGVSYRVQIDETNGQWLILIDSGENEGTIAASGHCAKTVNMRIKVKKALTLLGVPFIKESRARAVSGPIFAAE